MKNKLCIKARMNENDSICCKFLCQFVKNPPVDMTTIYLVISSTIVTSIFTKLIFIQPGLCELFHNCG